MMTNPSDSDNPAYRLRLRIKSAYETAERSMDPADWRYFHGLNAIEQAEVRAIELAAYVMRHGRADVSGIEPWPVAVLRIERPHPPSTELP